MKIPKNIESTESRKVLSDHYENIKQKAKAAAASVQKNSDDSVKVPLGRALQDTLESIGHDGARAERVAELKKLIQSGGIQDYFRQVTSEQVASKFAEEVDLEILTSKGRINEDEEEN